MNTKNPLSVKVIDGVLRIEIGIQTLAFAVMAEETSWSNDLIITEPAKFAVEMKRVLEDEEEDGTTMVHRMLDEAAYKAVENGAEGVEEGNLEDFLGEHWKRENNITI